MWLPRFECPDCREPVVDDDGGYVCVACGQRFEQRDGVYRFLTPRRAEASAAFLRQYRTVREREGRRAIGADRRNALPEVRRGDPHETEWRLRRESYAQLLRQALPQTSGPTLRVLDLGAGCGWLSHRLAARGHVVVAVDQFDDDADGLRACRDYPIPFAAVQADFDCLPFRPAQFDLAVFDGSLHYSPDPDATLLGAKRMLAAGGALAVLDSPMFRDGGAGERMVAGMLERLRAEHGFSTVVRPGVGFLTFERLEQAAMRMDVRGRFVRSRGPLTWRLARHWARLRLKREPAAFGVWVAR